MSRPKRRAPEPREPRVSAEDIARLLSAAIYPPDDCEDRSRIVTPYTPCHDAIEVEVVAQRAGVSTRTVYRWMEVDEEDRPLGTADRLLLAIGKTLDDVRLIDG